MKIAAALPALFLLLAACAGRTGPVPGASVTLAPGEPWREAARAEDAARIDALATSWTAAMARMPARGAKAVAAAGPLLVAGAALDHPELPPGSYDCRVHRLGAAAGAARLRSFPAGFCYVRGEGADGLSLTKQTGSDLPAGRLFPAGPTRYVFLGARSRRPGGAAPAYGTQPDRDVAGVVERVAPFRWRMVVPATDGRSIDVYELTPVPTDRQPG
ncbi:DUF4893 domain-containing protein [Sphingomonas sp. RS2018]